MMKKNNIRLNYIYNLCYQLLNVLLPLITTPYIARVLKADGVGKYSYSYAIAAIFVAVAQLGTVTFSIREIAYYQDNREERSRLFWEIFLFRCLTVAISLIIYYFTFCRGKNADIFLAQSLCILAVCFDISWYFQGLEQFGLITARDFFSRILGVICVFSFVKTHDDLILYTVILGVTTIIGRVANWFVLPRYLSKISFTRLRIFRNVRTYVILFVPQIANQLYLAVDKSMIGMITGNDYESGYYAQADKILKVCTAILTAVVTVLSPRIAEAFSKGKGEAVQKYVDRTTHFLWMISIPMAVGLISTIGIIIPWFLGDGYESVRWLIYAFSPHIISLAFTTFFGMLLVNTKKQNEYAMSVATGAVCNILMNAFLIRRYLSIGAVMASVVAELIIAAIQLRVLSKQMDLKVFFPNIGKNILASITMAVVVFVVRRNHAPTMFHSVVVILIGGIVYFLCLMILREKFFLSLVKQYLEKLGFYKSE